MVTSLLRALAIACVAALPACSSHDDVVATSQGVNGPPDGSITQPPTSRYCQAGNYSGIFFTVPGDGGLNVQYTGRINFALTETRSGEFLTIDAKAQLAGKGDDGSTFQAEIVGGSCREGEVDTSLQNGDYTVFLDAAKTMPFTVAFDGSIVGNYDGKYMDFSGEWRANLHFPAGDLLVGGKWVASNTN